MIKKMISIVVSFLLIINIFPIMQADASNSFKSTNIKGNISYKIQEDGSDDSKVVNKKLNNHPIFIQYIDDSGINIVETQTNENGDYSVKITARKGNIKTFKIGIRSENNAAKVTKKNSIKPYTYTTESKTVSAESMVINVIMDNNDEAIGAINIGKIMNDCHMFSESATGKAPRQTQVHWSYEKGKSTYQFSLPHYIPFLQIPQIAISGVDKDERDIARFKKR